MGVAPIWGGKCTPDGRGCCCLTHITLDDNMKPIRNSIKAIIIRDHHVLLVKNIDKEGFWYVFPGGGQNSGEDMHAALRRECFEETGISISVGPLRLVREYIGKNHEFQESDGDVHQVELYFECGLASGSEPRNGEMRDANQVDVEWVPLENLGSVRVYPKLFQKGLGDSHTIYLGDVN
jgi:8-oxo-dGTP diphosphatase